MYLVAQKDILFENKYYHPGEELSYNDKYADAWIESGSAKWLEELPVDILPKAKRVCAQPGVEVITINGKSQINLEGRIPKRN